MGDTSFEESLLLRIMRAVQQVRLDVVVIGNAAAALHGVPVTTQDVDLFVRETPCNTEKIRQLISALGNDAWLPPLRLCVRPFFQASRRTLAQSREDAKGEASGRLTQATTGPQTAS